MSSPHFKKLLEECQAIHDKKSADYSNDENPFSNFDFAASLTAIFKNPVDQVFACMIGIKIARLAELRNGKTPNNESIRDSHIDLTNYAGLWGAYHDSKVQGNIPDVIAEALKHSGQNIKEAEFITGMAIGGSQPYLQCPKCSFKTLIKSIYIEHATSMHSAYFYGSRAEITYPDGTSIFITI